MDNYELEITNDELNVPQIRFKGFSDAWEKKALGECLILLKDGTHGTHFDVLEGPFLLSAKNIKNGRLIIDNEIERKISIEDYNSIHSTYSLKEDDVLMTIVGTIGECTKIDNPTGFTFQRSVAILRPNNNFKSDYLIALINTSTFQKKLKSGQSVSAQPGIYLGDLSTISNNISDSLPEQTAIGSFFKTLDSRIEAQGKKIEKLNSMKKALLAKMFPSNNYELGITNYELNKPQIRFKGFSDAWEEKALGEVGSVAMNRRVFKFQTTESGDVPFYKIGTFGDEADAYITRELFEQLKASYSYPEIGDILLSASGSIGRMVEYTGKDEYFQDSNIVWLKHGKEISNDYLKCFYSVVKWSGLEGSTIKRLYNKNILETNINIPTLPEQEKIGSFFKKLDELIGLSNKELEQLKNIKSALLEKMFV